MIPLVLEEIAQVIEARPIGRVPAITVTGVSTDTRTLQAGELFFALTGQRTDGHEYVAQALQAGAVAAVVSKPMDLPAELRDRGGLLHVPDTLAALGKLGRFHRKQCAAEVVAVTGSNGKTTTQGLIQHLLSGRLRGRSSPKSYNNAIGVPLTLLSAGIDDDYLVCEIGTNARGEVAQLADMVRPDVGVITDVAEAHLAGLGTLSGVATEKLSLLEKVTEGGLGVVLWDNETLRHHLPKDLPIRLISFGLSDEADLRATQITPTSNGLRFLLNGRFAFELPMLGRQNVLNALAAIAVARRFGLEHDAIAERMADFQPPPMRLQREIYGPVTVINDAYNANPASTLAALQVLREHAGEGRKIAVLGDMLELGQAARDHHQRVGRAVGQAGFDLVAVGEHAELMCGAARAAGFGRAKTWRFADPDAAGEAVEQWLETPAVVLLKASRAVGLERVAPAIAAAVGRASSAPKQTTTIE
jgi:UDP-N-acetylmuramoyl-tripeptide--D-alanyl-D-alanine ligase